MEEKMRFAAKKGSPLPYIAAVLGAAMLALSFFSICPSMPEFDGFFAPVVYWFVSFGFTFLPVMDLLLILSGGMLLIAGAAGIKLHPVFCAVPNLLYTLFLFVWSLAFGKEYLFEIEILLPFILSVAVSVLSLITAFSLIKTKIPLILVSFAEAFLFLLLIFRGARGYNPGYPPVPFSRGYGVITSSLDLSIYLRIACLALGTGLLALSLEYTPGCKAHTVQTPSAMPMFSRQSAVPPAESQPVPPYVFTEKNVEKRLKELETLRDKGLITREEFENKRKDILEKL